MFQVNGTYANRKGKYTVLALHPPKMTVRYEDGSEAELKIDLQARIWDNIAVEYEAPKVKQKKKAVRKSVIKTIQYVIKVVSNVVPEELIFPGWAEKVILAPQKPDNLKLNVDDRVIFYMMDAKMFFAVATINGKAKRINPKKYFYNINAKKVDFLPLDIDASVDKLDNGVHISMVELESQPAFKQMQLEAESYIEINEDDFELIAELLTEVVADSIDYDDVEDDYSEEDEL